MKKPETPKQKFARTINFALFRITGMSPLSLSWHLRNVLSDSEFDVISSRLNKAENELRTVESALRNISMQHKNQNRSGK